MFLGEMRCMGCGQMGRLGIEPVTMTAAGVAAIPAISQIGTAVMDTVSGWFGGTTSKDLVAKQLKAAQVEAKRQAELQLKALQMQGQQVSAMEQQRADQLAYDAAMKQRSQQLMALYAVGGVAVLVAGYFIFQAMRKKGK